MKNSLLQKTSWSGLTLTVTALVTVTGLTLGCGKKEKVINIGYITEQTGSDAFIAQTSLPIMEDQVAKINGQGGIGGYKLKLISYDTRSEVTDAVAVTKRLIDQDKCAAIIGPSWTAAALPIAQIADSSKVAVVSTDATNENVTVSESGQLHPYMFRVCFIDNYQGLALADYAYNKMKVRKVGFLTDIASPYTVGVHKFFEAQFKKLGGTIVANEGYSQGDVEFRAQLAKLKDAKPDLLVSCAYTYKDGGLIAQQMEGLGFKVPFMGADGLFVDDLLPMAGTKLEGAIISTGAWPDDPEFKSFNEDCQTKFKVKPSVFTYFGMDALMAVEYGIKQAIEKGGKPDPTAIRDALENMQDVQLFTCKMTMEKDTHNPHNKPLLIMQIKDSKWNKIETYQPGK